MCRLWPTRRRRGEEPPPPRERKVSATGRVNRTLVHLASPTSDQALSSFPRPAHRLRAKAMGRCSTASVVRMGSISPRRTLTDTCSSSASAPAASLTRYKKKPKKNRKDRKSQSNTTPWKSGQACVCQCALPVKVWTRLLVHFFFFFLIFTYFLHCRQTLKR